MSSVSSAPHGPHRNDRSPPVWLPWVLAPAFLMLPMAGCGVSASLRRPQPSVQTAVRPDGPPVTTVATVVPTYRAVAWRPKAD